MVHIWGVTWGIIWGMFGASSEACLGNHMVHVWGIIWGNGACLGHFWDIIWGMSGHHLGYIVNNEQQSVVLHASVMPFLSSFRCQPLFEWRH